MSEASDAAGRRGRVGSVVNGKWQLDARIGAGGMSTVYAATHRNGTRAAIKMLHQQLSRDEAVRARFLREGYVANAVGHPGVCRVLDDGFTEDGSAFLVLELLEGETMEARRLRTGGAMPLDEVLDVADQALGALAAAHDKGIVHRDVKPENVFLTTHGQVKLLDFGLARMRDATVEATAAGVTIGTPEFMPPEQALGKSGLVDARSDVWGLGATMFTALSGRYVHETSTLHAQLVASATQRARSLRAAAPEVPPAIARVVDKALELEREDRWSSAGEMRRALRDARASGWRGSVQGGAGASSVTVLAAASVPSPSPSSDQTVPMSAPPVSDRRTLEGAAQTPPTTFDQAQTERLAPMGRPTPLGPDLASARPPDSTARMQTISSGSMRSALPPQQPSTLASSGSYPFVQLVPPPPPSPRRGDRGAIVASAILVFVIAAAALYRYVSGTPKLP